MWIVCSFLVQLKPYTLNDKKGRFLKTKKEHVLEFDVFTIYNVLIRGAMKK